MNEEIPMNRGPHPSLREGISSVAQNHFGAGSSRRRSILLGRTARRRWIVGVCSTGLGNVRRISDESITWDLGTVLMLSSVNNAVSSAFPVPSFISVKMFRFRPRLASASLLRAPFSPGDTYQFASKYSYQGVSSISSASLVTPSRHGRCTKRVAWEASASAHSVTVAEDLSEKASLQAISERRTKKKVAMWLGYVGTRYKGLQIQRGPGSAQTIEEELELAIFKAGGIIESNFGNLSKISWTRSSRTDKGVHSLCTVISMKMEVPETAWLNDTDGLALADTINFHLSPFIRVFGITPVTKSFRARFDCCTRTYEYLLPAAILGIHPDADPSQVEQRVTKFRSTLHLFEGKHAYHNYTIRRLYRPFPEKPFKSRSSDRNDNDASNQKTDKPSTITSSIELGFLDEEDMTEELPDVLASELVDEMVKTFAEDSRRDDNELEGSTSASPQGNVSARKAWWLPTPDESDKVWSSHFRKVISFTCGMPETFGEAHFIRISITGSSFMVHQIRKMIGTAIAVFHGLLPGDLIPISLARHSRVVLPLAPPDGLILVSNDFIPFRRPPIYPKKSDIEANKPSVPQIQEKNPKLEMSTAVLERVNSFCANVLMPDVSPLISEKSSNWSLWMTNLERNVKIPESELAELRAAWTEWREQSVRIRQMKKQINHHVPDSFRTD